jgi:hypothetical protein
LPEAVEDVGVELSEEDSRAINKTKPATRGLRSTDKKKYPTPLRPWLLAITPITMETMNQKKKKPNTSSGLLNYWSHEYPPEDFESLTASAQPQGPLS